MKKELRIILKLCVACCLPLFSFAQYEYHDWVENVEKDTVQSIEIWRITLQKRLTKIDSLLMDSILIENQDGSISTTEKYWRQNPDTVAKENDNIIRGPSLPMRTEFEYPDTVLFKRKIFSNQGLLESSEGYFSGVDRPQYLYKTFNYDENNRLIEQVELDDDSLYNYTYTYQFDDRKLTVRRNHLIEGELAQYCIWNHDKKGDLKSMANYWANGEELEWKSEYEHMDEGRLIIQKQFDGHGNHKLTVYKKFDSDDNELESIIYSADSTFNQGSYYSYDDNGNITMEKWVVSNGEQREVREHYEFTYEQNKLMKVESIEDDGSKSVVEKYHYDGKGMLESSTVFNDEGVPVTKFDYKYDKRK